MNYLLKLSCLFAIVFVSCEKNVSEPEEKNPTLSLSESVIYFEAGENEKSITVNNSSSGNLEWEAEELPEATWLSCSPTQGKSGDRLHININPDLLIPGTTSGNIRISSNGGEQNLSVTVLIPELTLSMTDFQFQPDEITKVLEIQNTGAGDLNWTVTMLDLRSWLSIEPESGVNDALVTFTINWDLVTADNSVAELVINSTAGSENITVSAYNFPSSVYLNDFSEDYNDWDINNATSNIIDGFFELTGTSSTRWGTAKYDLTAVQSTPWLVRAKFGRKNNEDDGKSALYMSTNDVGTVVIPSFRFIINPPGGDNFSAEAFIFSFSTFQGGWAYLEDDSHGFSSKINANAAELNDISWAITGSKVIQIFVNDELFYETNILNELDLAIECDLETIGIWTSLDQTTQTDWILVRDVDEPGSQKYQVSPGIANNRNGKTPEMEIEMERFEDSSRNLKYTLKEKLRELQ